MSVDLPTTAAATSSTPAAGGSQGLASRPATRRAVPVTLSDDSRLAVEIRTLVDAGDLDTARQRFEGLVVAHQRRAVRIAYQYLRDAAEADEAVQDAFVKVFGHIASYREAWPPEVWFTRFSSTAVWIAGKPASGASWLVPGHGEDVTDDRRAAAARSASPLPTATKRACWRANGGPV
jgi:hypothetical protein